MATARLDRAAFGSPARTALVNLGIADDRWFLFNCGMGIDARVVTRWRRSATGARPRLPGRYFSRRWSRSCATAPITAIQCHRHRPRRVVATRCPIPESFAFVLQHHAMDLPGRPGDRENPGTCSRVAQESGRNVVDDGCYAQSAARDAVADRRGPARQATCSATTTCLQSRSRPLCRCPYRSTVTTPGSARRWSAGTATTLVVPGIDPGCTVTLHVLTKAS